MTTLHKMLVGLSVFALAVISLATPLNAADSVLVGTLYTAPGIGIANFSDHSVTTYLDGIWAADIVVDGSNLYLAQPGGGDVAKYQGSTLVETYGGLADVFSIALRSDGALFAVSRAAGTQVIKKWGGTSWDDFASSPGVTVTPGGRIVFGPDKTGDGNPDLYVACTDGVYYCNGQTGGALTMFASREDMTPTSLAFRPTDGNLYVATTGSYIEVFSGSTGAWITTANYGDFVAISDMMWGPDKNGDDVSDLYLACPVNQGMWVTATGAYPFAAYVFPYDVVTMATIAPGSLAVHVDLPNFSGDMGLSPVRIQLIKNNVVMRNQVVFLDSSGNYTLTAVTPDTYNVAFSSKSCLRRIVTDVVVPGSGTGSATVSLPTGDLDGSGVVDLNDFSIVDTNFGLTNE